MNCLTVPWEGSASGLGQNLILQSSFHHRPALGYSLLMKAVIISSFFSLPLNFLAVFQLMEN